MIKKLEVISAVEQEFPRIVEHVVSLWGTPAAQDYLKSLVFDERGHRHGFPFDAASDLMMLEYVCNSETGVFDQTIEAKVMNNPQFGFND